MLSQNEIDEILAEEAGAPSLNSHIDRRATCRFFGHAHLLEEQYKGGAIKYCSYCARITHYWSDDYTGPKETRKQKQQKWKEAQDTAFYWEYMLTQFYEDAHHSDA